MEGWKIQDYKTRCYNLQNKLTPNEADESAISRQVKDIRRTHRCDELSALIILKVRLEKELQKKSADSAPLC